jgi:hypothetical protein
MRSGKRVLVGQTFESGEVLLEVDAAGRRIITNKRQVALI